MDNTTANPMPDLMEDMPRQGKDDFIARLHAEAPLYKDPNGFWIASDFEDVRAILLDHASFSSAAMGGGAGSSFPLLTDDPPRHSALRSLLAKAFTPAAIEDMRPHIVRMADDLVAAIPAGETVDIVERLTTPLPVAVIAGMMGVPKEREKDFKRWSNATLGLQSGSIEADRMQTLMELGTYFAQLSAERRANPGSDLISALTRVSDTSEALTDQQIVGFCILLMIAGNETTTNLLSNLLDRLAGAPDDWAALRADPALLDRAIEESLRTDSPIQFVMRIARKDIEIGAAQIKAGDYMLAYLASANRDPEKWNDPANFELSRERERHVAFGHGVHHCIGAPLARLEAKSAMTALLTRFASAKHAKAEGERVMHGMLFGYQRLPLVFG
jgi:cytochrome P450